MGLLSPAELTDALDLLDSWQVRGNRLERELRLPDFRTAITLVVAAAFEAEAANHHPDIDIRYNRVLFGLSTHSEGGITAKDVDLARAIDALATAGGA